MCGAGPGGAIGGSGSLRAVLAAGRLPLPLAAVPHAALSAQCPILGALRVGAGARPLLRSLFLLLLSSTARPRRVHPAAALHGTALGGLWGVTAPPAPCAPHPCALCSAHPLLSASHTPRTLCDPPPGTPCSAHPITTHPTHPLLSAPHSRATPLRAPPAPCIPSSVHPQLRAPHTRAPFALRTPSFVHPLLCTPHIHATFALCTPRSAHPPPCTPPRPVHPHSTPSRSHTPHAHTLPPPFCTPPARTDPPPPPCYPLSPRTPRRALTRSRPPEPRPARPGSGPAQGLLGVVVLRALPDTWGHPGVHRAPIACAHRPLQPCNSPCTADTHAHPKIRAHRPAPMQILLHSRTLSRVRAPSWLHGQPRAGEDPVWGRAGLRGGDGVPQSPPGVAVTRRRAAQRLSAGCSGAAEEEEISAGTRSGQGQGRPRGAPPAAGSAHCRIRSLWGRAVGPGAGRRRAMEEASGASPRARGAAGPQNSIVVPISAKLHPQLHRHPPAPSDPQGQAGQSPRSPLRLAGERLDEDEDRDEDEDEDEDEDAAAAGDEEHITTLLACTDPHSTRPLPHRDQEEHSGCTGSPHPDGQQPRGLDGAGTEGGCSAPCHASP